MNGSLYREKWRAIAPGAITPEALARLSRQVAAAFMDAHLVNGRYEPDYIALLCEMATFSDDPVLNQPAAQALFSGVVEGLCDEFEELQTETYNRVMAQVIGHCRRLPAAARLGRRLSAFGIEDESDLLARVERLRGNHRRLLPGDPIRKILLLSRVTIGADVAITSVMLQRLARFYPDAECVLVGGRRLRELFGGLAGLRFREVEYGRNGGLLERLETWHAVLAVVGSEMEGVPAESVLLADPDSRLSQLGILPLTDLARTLFFNSRTAPAPDTLPAMAELCNAWLNALLAEDTFCAPRVWLAPAALERAAGICRRLKVCGARRVAMVNFGVGGNRRKRIGRPFEATLLMSLLAEPDTVVLLDRGAGQDEAAEARALLQAVRGRGIPGDEIDFAGEPPEALRHGLIAVGTGIGEMAALIAASDEYIGYDSAGQHIAAALATPCVTVFAGSNNRRFIRRWRAFGPGSCRIVHVDTLNDPAAVDVDDIVTRIANVRLLAQQERRAGEAAGGDGRP